MKWPVVQRLITAVVCLVASCSVANGQESRTVNVPVTFDAEGTPLRSSACLQVTEWSYGAARWWEGTDKLSGPGEAVRLVLAAMKARNRSALAALSDSQQTQDTARFTQQSAAYFQQMQSLRIHEISRAYQFDDLVVFYAKMQDARQTAFVPLAFSDAGQTYRFLPNRPRGVTHRIVLDWFNAPWGPGGTRETSYCTDAEVKRATHQVSLVAATRHRSTLSLTGAPLDQPGPVAAAAVHVREADAAIKAAAKQSLEALTARMTPQSAAKIAKWAATASELETDNYKQATLRQNPIFVVDESTLVVVYTKAGTGIEVMYFTSGSDNRLKWTNAARATTVDGIFKSDQLRDAAKLPKPFSTLAIAK